ncbi:MAG: hypothetical protein RSE41_10190 [Clostridia bacterium]
MKIFKYIIDILVCILLVILSIKKGGFYESDIEYFNICIYLLFGIYIFINMLYFIKSKFKFSINNLIILIKYF